MAHLIRRHPPPPPLHVDQHTSQYIELWRSQFLLFDLKKSYIVFVQLWLVLNRLLDYVGGFWCKLKCNYHFSFTSFETNIHTFLLRFNQTNFLKIQQLHNLPWNNMPLTLERWNKIPTYSRFHMQMSHTNLCSALITHTPNKTRRLPPLQTPKKKWNTTSTYFMSSKQQSDLPYLLPLQTSTFGLK